MTLWRDWVPGWVVAAAIFLSVVTVWLRLSMVDLSLEISHSKQMLLNQKLEIEKLEVELARLKSPRRLESLARSKFNLEPPRPEQVIQAQ